MRGKKIWSMERARLTVPSNGDCDPTGIYLRHWPPPNVRKKCANMRKRRKEKQLKENFDPKNFRQEMIQIQSRRPFSINWFLFRQNEIFLEIFCDFCHAAQCPCLPVVPITKASSWQWRVEAFLRFYFCPQVREEKFLHGTLISGRNYEREKLTLGPSSQYFDWSTNND